jgi:hypothetical protein
VSRYLSLGRGDPFRREDGHGERRCRGFRDDAPRSVEGMFGTLRTTNHTAGSRPSAAARFVRPPAARRDPSYAIRIRSMHNKLAPQALGVP